MWFQVCLSQRTWDLKSFGTAHVTRLLWRWQRRQSESSARIPRDTSCSSKMSIESTLLQYCVLHLHCGMSGAWYKTMWGDDQAIVGSWFAPSVLFPYEAESITATTTASPSWLWRKPWCSTKPSIAPHSWPESLTRWRWSRLTTPTSSPLAATRPEGIPSLVMSKSSAFKTWMLSRVAGQKHTVYFEKGCLSHNWLLSLCLFKLLIT